MDIENKFLIISQPRTGSNNMAYCLNCHPDINVGNELFHPTNGMPITGEYRKKLLCEDVLYKKGLRLHWVSQCDDETFIELLSEAFQKYDAFKIHTSHIPLEKFELISRLGLNILLTVRRDKYEQAISNYVATIRNSWHAADRINQGEGYTPQTIKLAAFVSWINAMHSDLKNIGDIFRQNNTKYYVCEYESFYAGTFEMKIERLNRILDFLNLKRFGKLDLDIRRESFKKLVDYLDPSVQKVTVSDDIDKLIENRSELLLAYEQWRSRFFL